MLYYLFVFVLRPHFSPLNVFRYITVRTAMASTSALLLSLLLGPWVIERLRDLQVKQYIREEGPKGHHKKAGTPTMGGVLIVAAIVIPTLLWADLLQPLRDARDRSDARVRNHRLRRRLQQGSAPEKSGPHAARQIFLASAHLRRGRALYWWPCRREGPTRRN